MSTPQEKKRAIEHGRAFMLDMLNADSKEFKVADLKARARWVLRHFPRQEEIKIMKPEEMNETKTNL